MLGVALLAGCGGGGGSCVADDARPARRPITIARALAREPAEPVLLRGDLVIRGGHAVLCSSLSPATPPACREPSLRLEGYGNIAAAPDRLERSGRALLVRSTRIAGTLDEGVLRRPVHCSTAAVVDRFRDATGEELGWDAFISNSDAEHLSFGRAAVANAALSRRRETEWGRFDISVFLGPRRGLAEALAQQEPYVVAGPLRPGGAPPVVWIRVRRAGWIALSEYEHEVVLAWVAGARRSLDARWRRLDRILRGLG